MSADNEVPSLLRRIAQLESECARLRAGTPGNESPA